MRTYINEYRDDAVCRVAGHQGVTSVDARRALGGVTVPDIGGNRYALRAGSRFDVASRHVYRLMTEHGLLSRPDALAGLFNADYLPMPWGAAP